MRLLISGPAIKREFDLGARYRGSASVGDAANEASRLGERRGVKREQGQKGYLATGRGSLHNVSMSPVHGVDYKIASPTRPDFGPNLKTK